ncbi:hypothetical protein cypCar_00047424, partial [Cyprinus carpio]
MSVCDAAFDQQDAEVVCSEELDVWGSCTGAGEQLLLTKGDAQMWTQEIQCHLCPTSPPHKYNCSHDNNVGLVCADLVNVRLVGGHNHCSGRVEVLHRGQWGTVCGDGWDLADAAVVCRELDCGEPVDALGDAHFASGLGPIWMTFVLCTGSESTLKNCGSSGWGKSRCDHGKDAGVICSGYTDLRLVNGPDICSGRVERQYFSKWGTLCHACWDMRAASVLCRQLNCGIAVSVVGSDWFGEGSDEIWADVFDCDGNETKLSECSISSWSRAECSHRQDVGVICSNSSLALHDGLVRLSGERQCEGEVEVFIHQLGCGSVLNFYSSSSSSRNKSMSVVTGFQCSGVKLIWELQALHKRSTARSTQQLSITCLVDTPENYDDVIINGQCSQCAK